jgi:hypothetical protein
MSKKFTPNLNKKIFIINVGVNASHGTLRSPIFDDGTFIFVPIPETREPECPLLPLYREIIDPKYIPQKFHERRVHNDPEFITFTYGDFPTIHPRAANLKYISEGDYLFFLASLVSYSKGHFTNKRGFYLIGFFEIEKILKNVTQKPTDEDLKLFGQNAHIKRGLWKPTAYAGSWIFKGSGNSKLFTYAIPFTREIAEKIISFSKGINWKWPQNRTDLQVIGSYFRSCRIIKDKSATKLFWGWVKRYGGI